jgi:hypothetical protein
MSSSPVRCIMWFEFKKIDVCLFSKSWSFTSVEFLNSWNMCYMNSPYTINNPSDCWGIIFIFWHIRCLTTLPKFLCKFWTIVGCCPALFVNKFVLLVDIFNYSSQNIIRSVPWSTICQDRHIFFLRNRCQPLDSFNEVWFPSTSPCKNRS